MLREESPATGTGSPFWSNCSIIPYFVSSIQKIKFFLLKKVLFPTFFIEKIYARIFLVEGFESSPLP